MLEAFTESSQPVYGPGKITVLREVVRSRDIRTYRKSQAVPGIWDLVFYLPGKH